ncbi:MAG: hypothetical protein ACK5M7_19505 [Draconibacterium sp.]
MDTNELLIRKRAHERLLALAIAGICIILGFLLFLFAPDAPTEGTANLEWANKKFMMANVGPGVFFALFGAVNTVYSIVTQAKTRKTITNNNEQQTETTTFQLLQTPAKQSGASVNLRANYQKDFRTYSRILEKLNSGETIPDNLRLEFETTLNNTRQSLMASVWDEQWGDYPDFDNWLKRGCPEPVPDKILEAAKFFQGK